MKVSIIIPTKNRISFLKQTLLSVKYQTYKNIETIVVDDGSDEDITKYLGDFLPLQIIKNNTSVSGPSKARNLGIEKASGEYILFLDDDDLIHPEHINNLIVKSKNLPKNCILSSSYIPFSFDEDNLKILGKKSLVGQKKLDHAISDMINPKIQDNICIHSLLFPKNVFVNVKTKWDESLFTNGDIDFYGRALLNGFKLHGIATDMAYYRFHDNLRVAGTPSKKGLISSSRHKIKWSKMLSEKYQKNTLIVQAMQNSVMFLLLTWANSSYDEKKYWIKTLKKELKYWGGKKYYLPLYSSKKKKIIAELLLNMGGLWMWPLMHKLNNQSKKLARTTIESGLSTNEFEHHKHVLLKYLQIK